MIERCIVEAAARLRREDEPYLTATVVCVRGSAYRRPGARMLIARDRWIAGSVSGGCLEGDLVRKGWWRTQGGAPALVTYDSRVEDDTDEDELRAAFAVGCNGVVEVLIERAADADHVDALAFADGCLRAQRRGAVAVVFRGDPALVGARVAQRADRDRVVDPALAARPELLAAIARDVEAALASGASAIRRHGELDVFVEAVVPPPRLFVFGTGPDAVPVVALGRSLGWEVAVCAPGPRPQTRARFAAADELLFGTPAELAARLDEADRALAVVMAHDLDLDRAHLGAVLGSRAVYVGALGPRARTLQMLAQLGRDADARLHAPIGLELGAETPSEIGLAIVAEMQAVLARAPAGRLRDRTGPIHDRGSDARLPPLPDHAPRERVACVS